MDDTYQNPFVLRAIAASGGTQSELARRIGGKVRQGHVWKWLRMEKLTADACLLIEKAMEGTPDPIKRQEMRPDLFGEMPKQRRAA
ncbi:MAG TPA: YdaS family helix-turn-helix protein [Nevskia sp.]|nr:YdaS family helix-turn-helix protein [Nevskia sp.]